MKTLRKALLVFVVALVSAKSPLMAQLKNQDFGVGVGAGVTDIIQSSLTTKTPGLFAGVNFKLPLGDPSYVLRLSAGYGQAKANNATNVFPPVSVTTTVIPVSLALQLNLLPESDFNLYAFGGVGYTAYTVKANGTKLTTAYDASTTPPTFPSIPSGTLGVPLGVGFEYFVSNGISLDAHIDYNYLIGTNGGYLSGFRPKSSHEDNYVTSAFGLNFYSGGTPPPPPVVVAPPPPPPPPPPADIKGVGDKIAIHVNFKAGSSLIEKSSFDELDKLAQKLKDRPNLVVEISGHTDNAGGPQGKRESNEKYKARVAKANEKLSEAHANAVKAYLVRHKVPAAHISTRGAGTSEPANDKNRIEIKVTKVVEAPAAKGAKKTK
jgi:outer membrane protein OmpA-like peptidoglycan-associated protein